MPGLPDTTTAQACFYSTVRNISGHDLSFGFLGKHGKRLVAGAQYTLPGNIIDQLARNRRKFEALERAVAGFTDQAGNSVAATLAIVSTPPPHLYDAAHADVHTKVLNLNNNTLGLADPCWGTYTST